MQSHRYTPKQTLESELEARATALLRDHVQRDRPQEYPFYMPSSMRHMSVRDEALSHRALDREERAGADAALLLEALCDRAELGETNRAVLELTRQGLRAAQVAQRLQLTTKAVRRRLDRVVVRLRKAAVACGGAEGLVREAYEEQLSVNRYQPEQHCRPGREACRRDGLCRFRWYLYSVVAEQEEAVG